jgi:indolepyruvate ferredoxin oxidoreductase alpha subunit
MGTFYILRVATSGLNPVWSGDIGCYSLGINMGQQDLHTHMRSSVGLDSGIAVAGGPFVVATVDAARPIPVLERSWTTRTPP